MSISRCQLLCQGQFSAYVSITYATLVHVFVKLILNGDVTSHSHGIDNLLKNNLLYRKVVIIYIYQNGKYYFLITIQLLALKIGH